MWQTHEEIKYFEKCGHLLIGLGYCTDPKVFLSLTLGKNYNDILSSISISCYVCDEDVIHSETKHFFYDDTIININIKEG